MKYVIFALTMNVHETTYCQGVLMSKDESDKNVIWLHVARGSVSVLPLEKGPFLDIS